jgi:hypothetical protein
MSALMRAAALASLPNKRMCTPIGEEKLAATSPRAEHAQH